jgi:hypothetical protein
VVCNLVGSVWLVGGWVSAIYRLYLPDRASEVPSVSFLVSS